MMQLLSKRSSSVISGGKVAPNRRQIINICNKEHFSLNCLLPSYRYILLAYKKIGGQTDRQRYEQIDR